MKTNRPSTCKLDVSAHIYYIDPTLLDEIENKSLWITTTTTLYVKTLELLQWTRINTLRSFPSSIPVTNNSSYDRPTNTGDIPTRFCSTVETCLTWTFYFRLAIFLKTGIGPTPEPCGPTPIPVREGKNWKGHWNRKGRTVIPIPIQYNRAPSR